MAQPGWGTVPRMLRAQAEAAPNQVVVSDGNTELTLAQLRAHSARVAQALIATGLEPGDRVGIWAPNTAEWVVAAFGVWDAGGVLVPLSTRFKGMEAGELLERTETSVLFAAEGFLGTSYIGMLAELYGPLDTLHTTPLPGLPHLRQAVVLGEGEVVGATPMSEFLKRGAPVATTEAEARALSVQPDDLLDILTTSGTTGKPKGVMLEHSQMLRAYWDWSEIADLRQGDRYPVVSPFAHGFGIHAGMLTCVMRGATMLPIVVFDPDAALDLISHHEVSFIAGPPTLFSRLVSNEQLATRDVSSLRVAIVGAASVPEELVQAMKDRLGFERIVNAYGLIEGSVVTMTRAEDPPHVIATTAGRVPPGMKVRIVDGVGEELPVGERGEILVRGYGVTRGYWNAAQLTAECIVDGWLHTGDIGVLDDDGNLAIVGRLKDMFIVGGFNAYPAEIESLMLHHPAVDQVAVVAVPHPELGEVGCAFVVPERSATPTPDELVSWARENMSNYKVPRTVVIVKSLPVNANGKVDKAQLKTFLEEARQ